jgi:fumarate reductase subunit C
MACCLALALPLSVLACVGLGLGYSIGLCSMLIWYWYIDYLGRNPSVVLINVCRLFLFNCWLIVELILGLLGLSRGSVEFGMEEYFVLG